MKLRKFSKKATILALFTGLVLVAGIAFAAWTATGSGQGSAKAGSSQAVVVSAGTPTAFLYPTGSADVATSINNPNPFKVHVSSISLDSSQYTNGFQASNVSCNTVSLSYTTQNNGGSGWDIAAGATLPLDLSNAVSMSNSANDSCQSNTFTIGLTATAASAV
ncbi:MAG: hypothetical protein ACJ77A_04255 [Actinomycetota bacterium]